MGSFSFYRSLLDEGDLAFDIGANIGIHTQAMLEAGAKVVAVEPQVHLAQGLARRGQWTERLVVVQKAVSDVPGRVVLATASKAPHLATANASWRVAAHEPEGTWDGEQLVETVTLAELCAKYGVPGFLKVDTEGFDHLVLETLATPVRRVMFEVHDKLPEIAARCFDRLEELGRYQYRLMVEEAWEFCPPHALSREQILDHLPGWGDVYAEHVG